MKKIFIMMLALMPIVCGVSYAGVSGNQSIDPYVDVNVLGADEGVITTIALSTTSTLATLASARTTRTFLDVVNVSGNAVSIGVVQSTQAAGLFSLANTKALSDVFPGLTEYTGIIYGVATTTNSVKVLEIY